MINLNEFETLNNFLSKIDYGFILRMCIEIILFIVFLRISKKLINIFFIKIVNRIEDHEIKRQYATIKLLCISIVQVVVSLFFLTNLLGACGIDMKPILATAGVFGVTIGFGAKRFVEDIITGLVILLSGQIRVGDFVSIADSVGTVEKINLAMTKIRSFSGDVHYVRNGLIDKVINHTRDFSQPIVDIPISYEADVSYVIEVLKSLGDEIMKDEDYKQYILATPEIIAIDSFGESSVNLRVRFKTTAMQQWIIQRHFRVMVKKKFDELNIQIPFNQLDVHMIQN